MQPFKWRSFLLREYQTTAIPALFTVGFALIAMWTVTALILFKGEISQSIFYVISSFCATGFLGLGLLWSKSRNIPTILGTIIALFAAGFALFQVIQNYPTEEWIKPIWTLSMSAIGLWGSLVLATTRFVDTAAKEKSWIWWVVGWILFFAVFAIPFVLMIIFAPR